MANSNFRSDRSRDPLAELARLIGQGDQSSAGMSRETHGTARPRASTAREPNWAPEERYDPPAPRGEARYAPQPASNPSYASHQAQDRYQDAGYRDPRYQERGYQEQAYQDQGHSDQGLDHAYQDEGSDEHAGSRFFSGTAGQFNGFREEPGQGLQRDGLQHDYDDAPPQMPQAHDLPVFPFAADDPRYQGDEQDYAPDEAAPAEYAYRQRRSGPRTALVPVMAVLGLVVVGSAAAFGYRAMFGGSVLPTLPPIIKASNGPNKIALDPQAGAATNAQAMASTGSTENLVSREEQPVAIEAPKTPPRVVATIPVVGNGPNAMPSGMSGMAAGTAVPDGSNRVAAADPPWPAPPPPAAAAPAAAPQQPVQASSEPKKIHTVTIRTDQTGTVPDNATAAATAGVARPQSRAAAAPKAAAPAAGGGAAPMSIVPGQGDAAAPAPAPRVRTAVASPAASTAPTGGSGSYVQLTSRRSEAEAQAEFRAQQARFPDQLNGREPIIRRADLGEKGTFYRALVGPFASAEEAAQLCSSLKAAGGNCIVQQRN
jgi:SPOR domain